MIDLHIHTNHSDGSNPTEGILKKAQKKNLEYISITDHDVCDAYTDLVNLDIPHFYSGKIIPGIEIKCCLEDKKRIELLGYGIDPIKMQNWLTEFYKDKTFESRQERYFKQLYQICKEKGIFLAKKETIPESPTKIACFTIYDEIKRYPQNQELIPSDLWESSSVFARKYCGTPNGGFYIDKSQDYPTLEQTIHAIHEAGGLVFIAHPYVYNHIENIEDFVEYTTKKYAIDGLECYYSTFTQDQTDFLVTFCKANNLYASGGTDYHGEQKKEIDIGNGTGNLNITKNIIEPWIHKINLFP